MARRDPFGFTGELIDTQLRVGEPIGEGGFSVVYRGQHLGLDEAVAIKALKLPAGLAPPMIDAIVERFRAESRISYRLSQGNLDIVRSISSGTAHSPKTGVLVPYIALEWLDGPSLAQELKARRAGGLTGRPLGEAIQVLDPAAKALDYAHRQGVIHRDVKPGNLLLATTRDGSRRIKVLDFGLAKIIDAEGTGLLLTAQTVAQVILCSPSYGAPEQFDSSLGPISTATDVYSFALIVLELLRDQKVRQTASIGDAAKKALDPIPMGPTRLGIPVAPVIDALFQRTLALSPAKRPRILGEFWDELKRLAAMPVSGSMQTALPAAAMGPSPLGQTAPAATVPQPLPPTTQPMPKPDPRGFGGAGAMGKPPATDAIAPMGTVIMAERPAMPFPGPLEQAGATPSGSGAARSRPGEGAPVSLDATRVGEPIAANRPPPVVPSTLVVVGSVSPPRSSQNPGLRPSAGVPGKVILLVIVLLFLTSSVVVLGGYLAHRWVAARHTGPVEGNP